MVRSKRQQRSTELAEWVLENDGRWIHSSINPPILNMGHDIADQANIAKQDMPQNRCETCNCKRLSNMFASVVFCSIPRQ
jgi:hypothetical protein